MTQSCVECVDLVGKVIQTARIYKDSSGEAEIHIELTDGTCFSCCIGQSPTITATRYRGGVGRPEILETYEV